MLRALGWLLAIVVLIAGGWWVYTHTGGRAVSTSGEVFPRDSSSDAQDAKDNAAPASATPAPATPTPAPTVSNPAPSGAATNAFASIPTPQPSAPGLPVSDTLPRDPPLGMAFGGNGKYQWYRQGDITWRIDTVSGNTCIEFATMEQWARPIVYSHGCARS